MNLDPSVFDILPPGPAHKRAFAPVPAAAQAADYFGRRYDTLTASGVGPGAAARAVGRAFLKALVAAWMDAYAAERGYHGDPMFDPGRLFDQTANAAVRDRPTP